MELRTFGTHDGTFHADEVTACALLLVFKQIDRDQIYRTRELDQLAKYEYVCDVGGIYDPSQKRFDHHQSSYEGEMSSAGMVWLYLKELGIVNEILYDFLNRSFIWGVDAHDNGRVHIEPGTSTFSQVVSNFVPSIYDAPEGIQNAAFFTALDFVVGHIERLLERYRYIYACRQKVAVEMSKKNSYLFFPEAIPWIESFFDLGGEEHPALFVIMPSGGHWKLRGIPPNNIERMKVRLPLPAKWAGLLGEELYEASGIEGAIFCHKGRFISVWQTKEAAFAAMEKVTP